MKIEREEQLNHAFKLKRFHSTILDTRKRSGFKIVLPEIALHRLPPFAFRHPSPPGVVRESAALVRAFFPATA